MLISFWGNCYLEVCSSYGDVLRIRGRFILPSFEPDDNHIKWLCQTHEWLRPYFPFWNGVF
jgi:hypothetical protein